MPRSGVNGTYDLPPNTDNQVPLTTVSSAMFNAAMADIEQTFNTAQPIAYGGTGAATPVGALDALSTRGTAIPSAATTNIGAATGQFVHITGTTTITAFDTATAGVKRVVVFDGVLTLTHNGTSLILPGGADIVTAAGDTAVFVSEGAGNWRCVAYQAAGASPEIPPFPRGHIFGLSLSNNGTDAANDIDIAAGEAASDGDPVVLMVLASGLTKQLDAAWAVGTNQGMLDTGSVGDNTYYLWLIRRSDTGVVDVLASLSSTAPTMPPDYDQKRLIGRVARDSGANGVPVMYAQPETEISGIAPVFGVRAFASFSGSSGVAIGASGNVSSITRHSAGDYSMNFDIPMPDADYAVSIVHGFGTATIAYNVSSRTVSSVRFQIQQAGVGGVDTTFVSASVIR